MKHAAPPPPMSTYRPRLVEVQAIDCGDGRFVLLTEPPRYMPATEFEAAFELVEEKRGDGERRRANGRGRPKGTPERRGKRQANGGDPVKAEAQRLFEVEGKDVNEIRKKLKRSYSTVYSWSKKWGKQGKARPQPAAAPARPPLMGSSSGKRHVEESNHDDDWMK
jgi:hypothetical protein